MSCIVIKKLTGTFTGSIRTKVSGDFETVYRLLGADVLRKMVPLSRVLGDKQQSPSLPAVGSGRVL